MKKANHSVKLILFLLFLSSCATGQPKPASESPLVFVEAQDIRKLLSVTSGDRGELIRQNPEHFWAWSHRQKFAGIKELLKFELQIVGDPHYYNFGDVHGAKGVTAFSVVDIDDGGFGPAVLDFMKYASFVKYADTAISPQVLFNAYFEGLLGHAFQPIPEVLVESLSVTYSEILQKNQAKILKKIKNLKFKMTDLNLTAIEDLPLEDQKLAGDLSDYLLNNQGLNIDRIYDAGFTVHTSGGSKGKKRFWFLVKSENRTKVLEFKQLGVPGTAYFRPQKTSAARVQELSAIYLNVPESGFSVVQFRGLDFWLREKYMQVFDDKVIDDFDFSERALYAQYIANYMGRMQGLQLNANSNTFGANSYVNELSKNRAKYEVEIEKEIEAYLETLANGS